MFGSLGVPELLLIMVVALIVFGPRKLPEIGRTLGKALGEFRKATDDLKNTIEREVRIEELKQIVTETILPVPTRRDLQLLVAVGTFWGSETMRRFEFTPVAGGAQKTSRLGSLLDVFRSPLTSASHSEPRHES